MDHCRDCKHFDSEGRDAPEGTCNRIRDDDSPFRIESDDSWVGASLKVSPFFGCNEFELN